MELSFFGQYLVERKLISASQLADALELMSRKNAKLGQLAIQAGWLNEDQVSEIHKEQRRVDAYFGELSVKKNYLDEDQVKELLKQQAAEGIRIGVAVSQLGFLETDQIEKAFVGFEQSLGDSAMDTTTFTQPLVVYAAEAFGRTITRVCSVPNRSGSPRRFNETDEFPLNCSLAMDGDVEMIVAACLHRPMADELAMGMFEFTEEDRDALDDDLVQDGVAELIKGG